MLTSDLTAEVQDFADKYNFTVADACTTLLTMALHLAASDHREDAAVVEAFLLGYQYRGERFAEQLRAERTVVDELAAELVSTT